MLAAILDNVLGGALAARLEPGQFVVTLELKTGYTTRQRWQRWREREGRLTSTIAKAGSLRCPPCPYYDLVKVKS
jgi:acyl-coenzyme A thioesterase PaaI-like protein